MNHRRTTGQHNIMIRSAAAAAESAAAKSQLIELTPLAVQVARHANVTTSINEAVMMNLVANWMTDGFNQSVTSKGLLGYSTFQSIILTQLGQRLLLVEEEERDLQSDKQIIYTFKYQIFSVWLQQSGESNLPEAIIVGIEGQVLLENEKLLPALQEVDSSTGLGSQVTNVWAFLVPPGSSSSNNSTNSNSNNANNNTNTVVHTNNNTQLEVIIIVAVVVAGVALTVLSLAVIWAWRKDRKRRDVYRRGEADDGAENGDGAASLHSNKRDPKRTHASSPDGTGSSSSPPRGVSAAAAARIISPPPSEIEQSENGGGVYEESLISEDISTSLSAYYRSGLAVGSGHNNNNTMTLTSDHFGSNFNNHPDRLNDAGSLSSMESYGYSLDGYNSIAGASLQPPSLAATNKSKSSSASPNVMPSAGEIRRVLDED